MVMATLATLVWVLIPSTNGLANSSDPCQARQDAGPNRSPMLFWVFFLAFLVFLLLF